MHAPDHIKKYIRPITGENKFFSGEIYDDFTFGYEIACSCGNKEFAVYKNSEPKVTAVCKSCLKEIAVYDLMEYPCAVTSQSHDEKQEKVIVNGNDSFNIGIIIQYSDEFDFDDEMFDENGITWCQIFLYDTKNSQSIMIVDDETA